jgi:hypothetical protein
MTTISSPTVPTLVTSVHETGPRQTPPTAGQQFRAALENAATGLLAGVEQASAFVPGGTLVSAAIRSDGLGGSPEAPAPGDAGSGTSVGAVLGSGTDQTVALLELQQRMSLEQRQYMAVSNALKARHDTAKSVLGNVR